MRCQTESIRQTSKFALFSHAPSVVGAVVLNVLDANDWQSSNTWDTDGPTRRGAGGHVEQRQKNRRVMGFYCGRFAESDLLAVVVPGLDSVRAGSAASIRHGRDADSVVDSVVGLSQIAC